MVSPLNKYVELEDARSVLNESKIAMASSKTKHFFGIEGHRLVLANKTGAVSLEELDNYKKEIEHKIRSTYKGADLDAALKESSELFKSIQEIQKKTFSKKELRPQPSFKPTLPTIPEGRKKQVQFKETPQIREYIKHKPNEELIDKILNAQQVFEETKSAQLNHPEIHIDVRLGDLFLTEVMRVLDSKNKKFKEYRYLLDEQIEKYIKKEPSAQSISPEEEISTDLVSDLLQKKIIDIQRNLMEACHQVIPTLSQTKQLDVYDPIGTLIGKMSPILDKKIPKTYDPVLSSLIAKAMEQAMNALRDEFYTYPQSLIIQALTIQLESEGKTVSIDENPLYKKLTQAFYNKIISKLDANVVEDVIYRYIKDYAIDTKNYRLEEWKTFHEQAVDHIRNKLIQAENIMSQASLEAYKAVKSKNPNDIENDLIAEIFEKARKIVDKKLQGAHAQKDVTLLDLIDSSINEVFDEYIEDIY